MHIRDFCSVFAKITPISCLRLSENIYISGPKGQNEAPMSQETTANDLARTLTPRAQGVVDAATREFAAHGFAGATTDSIARRAGVSQPYVVRLFGSKERLFLRCCLEAHERVTETFRLAIAASGERPVNPVVLGTAYQKLIADPLTLQLVVQQNTMGQHPTVGPQVREWFMEIFRILRHEAGLPEEMARMFLARGMLIHTLLSLEFEEESADSRALLAYLAPEGQRPPTGS